jgi:2-amino-4-hydroxy-6-hydroxymethyldihydropteridine diphosphokinase
VHLLLGLGGNLDDPPRAFRRALCELAASHPTVSVSGLYRTAPHGPPQPRYWNLTALIDARGPLCELLLECQRLEQHAGRERESDQRWGPRPLDIDLLLTPAVVHRGPLLVLPHPRLLERAFALVPAAEIVPDWVHPLTGRSLAEHARSVAGTDLTLQRVGALDE